MKNSDQSIPTRESLLNRLKDWRDQESWQDFFDTYWRLIFNVAVKAGLTAAEAQDVVQETIVSVAKVIPEFKYNPALGSFKGFLLHITRWRIADHLRKRPREFSLAAPQTSDEPGTAAIERIPDPAGFDLENLWDQEWQENLAQAALERVKRRVNPKQYQLFDLYVRKNWSVEEITKTMDVTVHQVYTAKSRISALLKKEVQILEAKVS